MELYEKIGYGEMSLRQKVSRQSVRTAKCPTAKSPVTCLKYLRCFGRYIILGGNLMTYSRSISIDEHYKTF